MAVAEKKRRTTGSKTVVAEARGKTQRTSRRELFRSILGAALIFLFIRTFFIEAFRIPSGSMEPTLLVGDFLFVNKLAYGPHIPFTNINLPGYSEPKRGEIAVYKSPDASDGHPTVVKRIVGLPGDTLHMRNALLHVNGIAQRQGYGADQALAQDTYDPSFVWQKQYALGRSRFGSAPSTPTHDNWGPIVVPATHFFTLGDNRYNSKDARYYGFVPRENLRGRPLFIYFSIDWESFDARWSRIGLRF
ncbi:MAG TPA: signal peptidase I [Gemmatimonadaceae bacterium]|nr:signal peptidase I [Gemmatimonadaceae bacterium]